MEVPAEMGEASDPSNRAEEYSDEDDPIKIRVPFSRLQAFVPSGDTR